MRVKLALLAAAAVVFAPGWQASEGVIKSSAGAELAGRILAPTFDEASAASRGDRGAYKQLERAKGLALFSKAMVWRSAATELAPLYHLWVAVLVGFLLAPLASVLST